MLDVIFISTIATRFFRFNFNIEEPFVAWKDAMYYSILKSLYFCFSTFVEWHFKNSFPNVIIHFFEVIIYV